MSMLSYLPLLRVRTFVTSICLIFQTKLAFDDANGRQKRHGKSFRKSGKHSLPPWAL